MKQLPKWAKWLARNKDGSLYAYKEKPRKKVGVWGKPLNTASEFVTTSNEQFSEIKWADKEPTPVRNNSDDMFEMKCDRNKVNHASQYKQSELETIDIIQALLSHEQFIGYLRGSIIEHQQRVEYEENVEQDYAKAKWYYDKLMEVIK